MKSKSGLIGSLKRHFWAQKGGFKRMALVDGESYELLMRNVAVILKGRQQASGNEVIQRIITLDDIIVLG
jgi:hypothetical protein